MRLSLPLGLALLLAAATGSSDERVDNLPPEHREWLNEEVGYIILDEEREVFLSLDSREERERFIEAFWRKRDPEPTTPKNEFREEHYRRMEFANRELGRASARPGWMTDRGRMYILLGEPVSVERFEGYNEVVASELWFYDGDVDQGLPAFFYLLFYRPHNTGEYLLYDPVSHGPRSLLSPQYFATADSSYAFELLNQVSPELRRASISLDPAEPGSLDGTPSLGSSLLIAKIHDLPRRWMRSDYADAWIRYGGLVESDYSFNFVPSRSRFAVLLGPERTPFVHFTVEIDPEDFALETDENRTRFYTTLDVTIEVLDDANRWVTSSTTETYLELDPQEVRPVLVSPFAYQGSFPLVPGRYQVRVILKNRVLKRFTVAETKLDVPTVPREGPFLSDVVTAYGIEAPSRRASSGQHLAFQTGDLAVSPAADGLFVAGETIHALVQVVGASEGSRLRFQLSSGSESVAERVVEPRTNDEAVLESFPLSGLAGGFYSLRVRLEDGDGEVLVERTSDVVVSPRSSLPRPWTYKRSFDTGRAGSVALAKGEQLLALGRVEDARRELEKAVAADNPELPSARWRLAALLIQSGEDDRAIELLGPLESRFPNQFEVIAGLGIAHYLRGELSRSVEYLERAIGIRDPNEGLLNSLADGHHRLGNAQRARELFERSLELNPEQPQVLERLRSLGAR